MNKIIITILLTFFAMPAFNQASDSSKIENLTNRLEKVESFQANTKTTLENDFKALSIKIDQEYNLLRYLAWFGLGLTITGLFGLWWKGKKYIEIKLKEKFDNIITEKEGDILALIDKQVVEKQIVNNKTILVLTTKKGDDAFLRKFFKAMKFPIDHVNYKKVEVYEKIDKKYDLIFANNETGDLDKTIIDEYFEGSNKQSVLFYFNTSGIPYRTDKVSDRLSFANSKTQIYGNLINLLKYQDIL